MTEQFYFWCCVSFGCCTDVNVILNPTTTTEGLNDSTTFISPTHNTSLSNDDDSWFLFVFGVTTGLMMTLSLLYAAVICAENCSGQSVLNLDMYIDSLKVLDVNNKPKIHTKQTRQEFKPKTLIFELLLCCFFIFYKT